jgi:hypothetical protein
MFACVLCVLCVCVCVCVFTIVFVFTKVKKFKCSRCDGKCKHLAHVQFLQKHGYYQSDVQRQPIDQWSREKLEHAWSGYNRDQVNFETPTKVPCSPPYKCVSLLNACQLSALHCIYRQLLFVACRCRNKLSSQSLLTSNPMTPTNRWRRRCRTPQVSALARKPPVFAATIALDAAASGLHQLRTVRL